MRKNSPIRHTMRFVLGMAALFLWQNPATAQDSTDRLPDNRCTTHATLFGIGRSNLLETYLSPYSYTGPQLSVLHESLRKTHWLDGRITTQRMFDGNIAYTDNRAETADEMAGKFSCSLGWHYNWTWNNGLRLMLGGELHAGVGFIYNTRNSNNPVQAKAETDLAASALLIYPFHVRKVPFTARYQVSAPLVGAMFSPRYGQSYYEMSLGGYDRNVRATWPGNAPSMRHFLTLDFPICGFTFRTGYLCDIRQSNVNGLRSHNWNHSFMIGYVKHFRFVKRKEPQHNPFIL